MHSAHDNLSIRGSITSFHKISRTNSFRRDTLPLTKLEGAGVEGKQSVLKTLVRNIQQKSEEEESPPSFLRRLTSKSSRKSGLSVSNMEDVIKFKLVEDLSLVTVPVTTCLIVLVSYILLGAALFSAWEVGSSFLTLTYTTFLVANSHSSNSSSSSLSNSVTQSVTLSQV